MDKAATASRLLTEHTPCRSRLLCSTGPCAAYGCSRSDADNTLLTHTTHSWSAKHASKLCATCVALSLQLPAPAIHTCTPPTVAGPMMTLLARAYAIIRLVSFSGTPSAITATTHTVAVCRASMVDSEALHGNTAVQGRCQYSCPQCLSKRRPPAVVVSSVVLC